MPTFKELKGKVGLMKENNGSNRTRMDSAISWNSRKNFRRRESFLEGNIGQFTSDKEFRSYLGFHSSLEHELPL